MGAENSIDTLGGNKLPCLSGLRCAEEFARELVETPGMGMGRQLPQNANAADKAPKKKKKLFDKNQFAVRKKFAYV